MLEMPKIPNEEFTDRIKKTQSNMKKKGFDLLFAFGNEAEPQFVRYYSDYSPAFETAGVLIPSTGDPVLLIGPESETLAVEFSRISEIKKLLSFRESSEPDYPDMELDTFEEVIKSLMGDKDLEKVGIVGKSIISYVVYKEFSTAIENLGKPKIVRADELVNKQRMIKSKNEIACLEKAYEIVEYGLEQVVNSIKIGMTENEVKGIALKAIFEKGAEAEGYPFWILTGEGSNKPVGKIRNKTIKKGDLVQVQISARYEGYVSTVGRPMVAGKATKEQKDLINAALTVEKEILKTAKPDLEAKKISELHYNTLDKLGFADHILYGPVHGTGLMENEHPWIESTSEYLLKPDMTFCTCLYLGNDEEKVGIRVENGFQITDTGTKLFSDKYREVIEFD